ncbi:DUF397 domain-containing protein [Yinghuangia sp. YIM S09857]|uniref:DUF397 domain-containing protein n=1 Tax=Yinghuangia sp. YIM S09857 TaxID=3436929 RepID=UPI003F533B0E
MTTGQVWRKSSYSSTANNDCVEVAFLSATTGVRDSKDRRRGHLSLAGGAWNLFLDSVRSSPCR